MNDLYIGANRGLWHIVFLALLSLSSICWAEPADEFVGMFCMRGLEKTTMSKPESQRFCGCFRTDIAPRLTANQRAVIANIQADISSGRNPSSQQLLASGLRDLVIAAQARCEAALYPPSSPINITKDSLQLTLRCEVDTLVPEVFVVVKGGDLLSKEEINAMDKRMMSGNYDSEYAQVSQKIDGVVQKVERWEIGLSGQTVSPLNPAVLIKALRGASTYEIVIQRGHKRFSAIFPLASRIPPRWVPCGGVGL